MGSQRVAKLSPTRQTNIQNSINKFSSRSPQANTQAARTAATAVGAISRSSAFVKSLSSESVAKSIGYLVSFANRLKVKSQGTDDALAEFGVGPDNQFPVSDFIVKARERLQEDLRATQKDTDPANAAADAIHRSVLDLLKKSVKAADVRAATREQLTEAFRNVSAREITSVLLEHVVINLVNIVVDAAGGGLSHAKVEGVKKRVGEEFASDFVKEIARLAKSGGVMPTQIPSKIPEWATELERFASKYRS